MSFIAFIKSEAEDGAESAVRASRGKKAERGVDDPFGRCTESNQLNAGEESSLKNVYLARRIIMKLGAGIEWALMLQKEEEARERFVLYHSTVLQRSTYLPILCFFSGYKRAHGAYFGSGGLATAYWI